jgi:hypothetical protein
VLYGQVGEVRHPSPVLSNKKHMIIIYKKKAAVRSTGAPFTEPSLSVVSSLRCLRQLLLSTDPLGILDSHLYVLLPGLQGQRLPLPESKLMDLPDAPLVHSLRPDPGAVP